MQNTELMDTTDAIDLHLLYEKSLFHIRTEINL